MDFKDIKSSPYTFNISRQHWQSHLSNFENRYQNRDPKLYAKLELITDKLLTFDPEVCPRYVFLCGSPGCLSGETFLNYNVRNEHGAIVNGKGGAMRTLYGRFQNEPGKVFTTASIDNDGAVRHNVIQNVIYSGVKGVWRVTTIGGFSIKATEDHKFFVGDRYEELRSLKVGDIVFSHTNYIESNGRNKRPHRKEVAVKYHPHWSLKVVNGCIYYRTRESRAVYEASLNGMEYQDYIEFLNKASCSEIDSLVFIPMGCEVHHEDENINNNDLSNLKLVTPKEHFTVHEKEVLDRITYYVQEDIIVSIEYVGEEDTYDIQMSYPYNNFIANNIVVHNCGKTHFMVGLYRAMVKKKGYASGDGATFVEYREMVAEIIAGFDSNIPTRTAISAWTKPRFLFLDDISSNERLLKEGSIEQTVLRDVFIQRYETKGTVVVSTNYKWPELNHELDRIFGDYIRSRLTDCFVIEFPNIDFRRKK